MLDIIEYYPDELKRIIFSFIPIYRKVFLNTYYYYNFHKYIKINNTENYIRDIIRNDNSFVFKFIIKDNFYKWKLLKKYLYKNIICYDYLSFVNYYIIQNKANKCQKELNDYLKEEGMSKNEFKKKNTIINKRWKH
jgi:hypothetical protein